jgi:poly(A) polymerase
LRFINLRSSGRAVQFTLMPGDPQRRQPCDREDALAIVRRLRDAGHVAYFAGGCVRDLLLGETPKDYDVATDAPPDRVRELFRNSQAVGAAFGVILVRQNASVIEVATFRSDGLYLDGRRPSTVRFTTAEEDARRRDFTINGLFLDPIADQVIDHVGGLDDLKARRVRAIGSPAARFDEDSLRLLRAVRFSSRLGFEIEAATADAIRAHAPQLRRISPERIAEELRTMLTPATRPAAWELLWKLELTREIFRFLSLEATRTPDPTMFLFPRAAPGQTIPFGSALAFAAVCYQLQLVSMDHDPRPLFDPPKVSAAVHALRKSLKISNEETDAMRSTLSSVAPLLTDAEPGVATMKRFLAGPQAAWSRSLLDALAASGLLIRRMSWLREKLSTLELEDVSPTPLLDGDMLAAAGLTPGPLFRRLLDAVYDAQLEGRLSTSQEALTLALSLANQSATRDTDITGDW